MIAYVLLFFFKQKTAYEMRISDWSSDVCSSDLLRLAYRERGRELDDIALRTSYDQKMGSLARFHQAGKAESLKRITSLLDQVIEGEEAVLEKRSEEHTSELQSLMRISYAVFCLKKKILKTPTRTHTKTDSKNN